MLVDAVCAAAAAAAADDGGGNNNVEEALLAVGKAKSDMSGVVKGMKVVGCKFVPRPCPCCWCRWIDELDSAAMAAVDVGD